MLEAYGGKQEAKVPWRGEAAFEKQAESKEQPSYPAPEAHTGLN